MSANLPSGGHKNNKHEPFGFFIKSMNDFFQERPVKGFLQSIDEFFKTPFPTSSFMFAMDVIENDKEHIITAELPGVNREQIEIDILNNFVTISVSNREMITEEDEQNKIYRKSQSMQKSSRTISLSHPIDERKVKATYQDGLLKIHVPKQKGKKININD